MFSLAVILIGLQGLAMMVDEFYFHQKRGLGRWESIGHPIDSLCFLIPIALTFWPYNTEMAIAYIASAVLSCLIITKDEWVHSKECEASENWLHAVLFVLHSAILFSIYQLWTKAALGPLNIGLVVTIALFASYQVIRWNVKFSPLRRKEHIEYGN